MTHPGGSIEWGKARLQGCPGPSPRGSLPWSHGEVLRGRGVATPARLIDQGGKGGGGRGDTVKG